MAYFIDDTQISLDDLYRRIEDTDLVPSRAILLDGLEDKMNALKSCGLITLADLRYELKTPKKIVELSERSHVPSGYLNLLRREIEGYLPKPIPLTDFNWIDANDLTKLTDADIKTSAAFFNVATKRSGGALLESCGVKADSLETLRKLCDLTRVQWVSPAVARMLLEDGIDTPRKLASIDAERLCADFERINAGGCYFAGKIGLRDVRRLVRAAGYVTD